MSAQTDAIRAQMAAIIAAANVAIAEANSIDAGVPSPPPPPPSGPVPLDCLTGTVTPRQMNPAPGNEQDMGVWNQRVAQFDAANASLPGGTILLIGDSITYSLNAAAISPRAYNMGISGDTVRGFTNRVGRNDVIHRAGACVLLMGINDLVWEGDHYGLNNGVKQSILDVNWMYDQFKPNLSGKWLVLGILPINTTMYTGHNISNLDIETVNAHLAALFAGSSVVTFLDLRAQLIDANGQLRADYADDGVHLSAAGRSVVQSAIASALQQMGVQ